MKKSVAFTGNNYENIEAVVTSCIRDKGNNPNAHVNNILKQHFESVEFKMLSMKVGEQQYFTNVDYDAVLGIRNTLKQSGKGEWQTVNGGGELIIKRTK